MPLSYIKFLIDSITDWNVNARMVDMITLLLFLTALILSIIFNVKDRKLKEKQKTEIKKKEKD